MNTNLINPAERNAGTVVQMYPTNSLISPIKTTGDLVAANQYFPFRSVLQDNITRVFFAILASLTSSPRYLIIISAYRRLQFATCCLFDTQTQSHDHSIFCHTRSILSTFLCHWSQINWQIIQLSQFHVNIGLQHSIHK